MKKLTLALLLVSLILTVFAACGEGNTEAGDTTDAGTEADTTTAVDDITTEASKEHDLPADLRFDGEEFNIATYEGGNIGQGWACFFDVDEPEAGNILEEAAYTRNQEVENRLGVTINCHELWQWDGTSHGLMFAIEQCGLSGKDNYQTFFMESFITYEPFIIDELVADVAAMPYIDLDKPYYNKSANDVYYLRDNLYIFISDITYACQNANQWLVNNEMLVDLGYGETYLYDKVNEGSWVLEDVFTMIEGLRSDLNTDGVYDHNDRWGFSGQPYAACGLFPAAGIRGTILTEDGFVFEYGSDYAVEVVDRLLDLVEHEDTWFDYGEAWRESFTPFWNGNSLFLSYASEIRALNQIEFDFGILPLPKYRESQETYSTPASGGITFIPATIQNEELVGAVIEVMASASAKHFVPAFYENFIEQGVIRDDYSRENWAKMLGEWGIHDFTRGIAPDGRICNYAPAYTCIGAPTREYLSAWDAQKGTVEQLCQEFFDWYLAE